MSAEIETDGKGIVKLSPLTGFSAMSFGDVAILLKLDWATAPEHLPSGDQHVQLAVSPQEALKMAEALQKLATHLLSSPQSGQKAN